jgi:hypothetical protein
LDNKYFLNEFFLLLKGYLSHIIMSQEMPPSVAAVRTTPSGMTAASQQQQGGGQMQIPTTDHQQYRQSHSQV